MFDQSNEDIAFSNSIISQTKLLEPSTLKDTLVNSIKLSLFKEESRIQILTGFSRDLRNKISLAFSKKPTGSVTLNPIGFEKTKNWFIEETNKTADSLIYWITNEKILSIDTLEIITSYKKTDSLLQLQPFIDTLKFVYAEPEKTKTRRKDDSKIDKLESLSFSCNIKEGKSAKPNLPVYFRFSQPLKNIDQSKILLYNFTDSTQIENLTLTKDSINPRIYSFDYSWINSNSYKFLILPGAFNSIDNKTNDSLKVNFKGANPEEFGTLSVTLKNAQKSIIVELLTESGGIVSRTVAAKDKKPVFSFIEPGKYRMRFIEDGNNNGKWDTGNYLKKRQPERVFVFDELKSKGIINVRANWENEIIYDIPKK